MVTQTRTRPNQAKKAPGASRGGGRNRKESLPNSATWRAAGLLVLACALAYLPLLWAGFVWDDENVYDNPLLCSLGGLARLWISPSLNAREEHYWPMVYSVFWGEFQLFGAKALGYHLVNLALHAANVVLFWGVLRRLAVPGALFAAAVFALHPVHVESVAWVIELKDVLSALFYLLAMHAFLSFYEQSETAQTEDKAWAGRLALRRSAATWYAVALAAFAFGMLSKSIVITFPAALLLVLWWKRGRLAGRDWLRLAPFFGLALLLGAADLLLVRRLEQAHVGLSLSQRLSLPARAAWFYARELLWPVGLLTIYPRWTPSSFISPVSLAAAGALLALLGVLFALRKRLGRGPLAAVLFFLLTLAPVLGMVEFSFMEYAFVADRFQYLASMGLIVLIGAAGSLLMSRVGEGSGGGPRRQALITAAALVLVALGGLSFRQSTRYQNMETLFLPNVKANPSAVLPHYNLARYYSGSARPDEAVSHYQKVLELKPSHALARTGLGVVLERQGKLGEAMEQYRLALEGKPADALAHLNLAQALVKSQKPQEALGHFQKAVELQPGLVRARNGYGVLLAQMGRAQEAEAQFNEVLRLEPQNPSAKQNLEVLTRQR